VPGKPKTYVKLAEAMNARRLELGLRWADVTARGGPSVEQMVLIRRGTVSNIRDLTLAAIAKGLDWPLEHVLALAAEDAGEDAPQDAFEQAIMGADLPDDEKAAAIRRHREQAREMLNELGISDVPEALRRAVRRYAGATEPGDAERRGGA
jgi:hypothetical protein